MPTEPRRARLLSGLLLLVAFAAAYSSSAPCIETEEYLYIETPAGALATYRIALDGSLTLTASLEAHRDKQFPFARPAAISLAIQAGERFAYSTDPFAFLTKCYSIDPSDGHLSPNPAACDPPLKVQGLLTMSPHGEFLYVSQYDQAIYPYAIDQVSGHLSKVGSKVESGIFEPPALTESGKYAYVLHRRANNIASYRIASDGSMQPIPGAHTVPTGAGPNSLTIDSSGNFAYVANLSDETISEYFVDPVNGALKINPKAPSISVGSSPYSLIVDANGRFLYCMSMPDESIRAYRIEADGALQIVGQPTKADNVVNAALVTDPAGKFVYARVAIGPQEGGLIGFSIAGDGHLMRLNFAPIPVVNDFGTAPAATWSATKRMAELPKRDLASLLAVKPSLDGTFTRTGNMSPPRGGMGRLEAGLLDDGRAFVAEPGFALDTGVPILRVEIYDPRRGTFTSFRDIPWIYVVAKLKEGRLLVKSQTRNRWAGILDPATMKVTPNGHFKETCHLSSWLLKDGRVLFPYHGAIGEHITPCAGEIYDLATGQGVDAPAVLSNFWVVAVLSDGRLLLMKSFPLYPRQEEPAEAYTYDLASGDLKAVGPFPGGRYISSPVQLADGRVFLVSQIANGDQHCTGELFDPVNSKFVSLGPLSQLHGSTNLTRLRDGRVLITGGLERSNAELFDPHTLKFSPTGTMTTLRTNAIVVLRDGNVLFAGGDPMAQQSYQSLTPYDTAEIYHTPIVLSK